MRALTVTQPYAGLLVSGIKRIENRTRKIISPAHFGTTIAIHASREIDNDIVENMKLRSFTLPKGALTTGAILGVAELCGMIDLENGGRLSDFFDDDDVADQLPWLSGPIVYVLGAPRMFTKPISCKGMLGLWTFPPNVQAMIDEQMC